MTLQSEEPKFEPSVQPGSWWLEWLVVLIIVALAAFLRFYLIGQVPPGLNSDEAVGAVGGLRTLREGPQLFYEGQGGGGPVGFYFVAATFALFGPSIASIRGLVAAVSVLAVAVTYALFKEMFGAEGPLKSRGIAALAALGLATNYWHVSVSRIAFAGGGVLLFEVCCFYFLWRGMRTAGRGAFVAAGLFLALSMSIYLAGDFLPLALALFFAGQWASARLAPDPANPPLLEKHLRRLLLMAAVAGVLVSPLVYFLLRYPELALGRARQAAITNPLINQGDLWGLLLRSVTGNFAAFGLTAAWLQGIPSGLLLPPILSALLIAGLLISAFRLRRPPYLFNLIWWPVMILPSILSPDIIPHILRASGALPATFVFPAIAVVSAVGLVATLAARLRVAAAGRGRTLTLGLWAVAILLFGVAAYSAGSSLYPIYQNYFFVWPNLPQVQADYHVYAVHLAEEMNKETNPGAVFILPLDTSSGSPNPNYTVEFLSRGPAGFAWILDDETTLPAKLTEATRGRDLVHLVQWKTHKHTEADPKDLIVLLLFQHSTAYMGTDKFPEFDILTFKLRSTAEDFTVEPELSTANASFAGQMQLVGFAYDWTAAGLLEGPAPTRAAKEIPSGEIGWVKFKWRKEAGGSVDYKTAIIVEDSGGHVAAQRDSFLLSNLLHSGTSKWEVGQEEYDYCLFRVKYATAPGLYRLKVVVYDAASGERLAPPGAGSDLALTLGEIEVTPAIEPVDIERLDIQHPAEAAINDEIKFLGYDTNVAGSVRPGDRVELALYWQATKAPAADYGLELWLSASPPAGTGGGETPIVPLSPLAGESYPSRRWQASEVLRGWQDLRVPAEAQSGEYALELRVKELADGKLIGRTPLGSVKVEGRPRLFEPPPMAREVGAHLGQAIELLGYDLPDPQIGPGGTLSLTLYWRALSEIEPSYTVFVHLLDESGQIIAQRDSVPQNGEAPTSGWVEGEIIADSLEIPIPTGTPGGQHVLEVGMYDAATGVRLPVLDASGRPGGDKVLLEEVVAIQ
jgi:4-amino-4-deoxy-L-arabinose transferase-like glycosyltransferase